MKSTDTEELADEFTPLSLSPAPKASSDSEDVEEVRKLRSPMKDLVAGCVNLVNTIIGGGLLALPFAIASCGLIFGMALVLIFFALSIYTGRLIVRCAMPPINGGLTYAQLAESAFGKAGLIMVETFIILFCLGTITGYLVIIGDLLSPYVNLLFTVDRRLVMLFFGALICLPLSSLRKISMLRFSSMAGLFFIAYLVIVITISSIIGLGAPDFDSSKIVFVSLDGKFLTALPIIAFAFTFHTNVPMVWREFGEFPKESKIINRSIFISAAICCILYLVTGIFGYLSFFELTSDNILTHYPLSKWYFTLGKVGYAFVIIFSCNKFLLR